MLELLLGRVTVPILSDIAYNVFDPMSTVKSPISGLGRGSCTACVASNTDPTPEGEAAKPIRPSSNQMRPFSVKRVWIFAGAGGELARTTTPRVERPLFWRRELNC